MAADKPASRMTLRELIVHAEKSSRASIDHLQSNVLTQLSDFRDLSRPVRRRSHYPTMLAMQNALKNLLEAASKMQTMADDLQHLLERIRDSALKERASRL